MPVLKVKKNGVWEEVGSSSPTDGGNADTLDGKHAEDFASATDLENLQNNKVDKVDGKGLSTNDFTDAEKEKLAAISSNTQNITTYNDPSQFGCTYASTLTEVYNAIPNNSIFICKANFTDASWNLPSTYGTLLFIKMATGRAMSRFYGKTFEIGDFKMHFDQNTNEPTGVWIQDLSSVLNSSMYGTKLPGEDGKEYTHVAGRLFFKKVSE